MPLIYEQGLTILDFPEGKPLAQICKHFTNQKSLIVYPVGLHPTGLILNQKTPTLWTDTLIMKNFNCNSIMYIWRNHG